MNMEKLIVRLSKEERQELENIVKKLKGTSQKPIGLSLCRTPLPMGPNCFPLILVVNGVAAKSKLKPLP